LTADARTLLATEDLTMRFGGVLAVNNVTFSMTEGELRCLIGPNGAGKSTFFKCLTQQFRPSAGRILFRDHDITRAYSHDIARLGIGIKTQVPSVFDNLTARENIWIAASRRHQGRDIDKAVEVSLTRFRLTFSADSLVGRLSHGERQWVELAMVVTSEPVLILLDEPTAGMTHDEVHRTAELIRDINQTASLIVVDHDMQFVSAIASKVTVFHQGAILVEDNVDRIMQNPVVRDIYLGKKAEA
jgi:branched-chain amino acid transport system ATP-binding protein